MHVVIGPVTKLLALGAGGLLAVFAICVGCVLVFGAICGLVDFVRGGGR